MELQPPPSKGPQLTWSSTPPTEHGHYWYRSDPRDVSDTFPEITVVFWDGEQISITGWDVLGYPHGEFWPERILEPPAKSLYIDDCGEHVYVKRIELPKG